jgi:hypothetical protein
MSNKLVVLTFAGIALLVLILLGFFISTRNNFSSQIERFDEPKSTHSIYGVAVDSTGKIHFGLTEYNAIQVYDNTGTFLYGFSFPTDTGVFTFYIDPNNIVHVATARGRKVFSFENGYLVNERMFAHANEFTEIKNNREMVYFDYNENKYIVRAWWVWMHDRDGNFVRIISPYGSFLPLSAYLMLGLAVLGIIVVIVAANRKFFTKRVKDFSEMTEK